MQRIYQIGIIRSGSTMLYQVLWNLFPYPTQIIKQHHFLKEMNDPVVATYRDFRDILVSTWRTFIISKQTQRVEQFQLSESKYSSLEIDRPITEEEIHETYELLKPYLKALNKGRDLFWKSSNVLWMKYEIFHDNFDFVFNSFEEFFGMSIEKDKRDRISDGCSLARNKERASCFEHFGQYDAELEIHGDHINKGEVGGWKDIVPAELHEDVNSLFENDLKIWGYK